jgi:hypothetical protein
MADPRTIQRPMSRGYEPPPSTWTPAPEPAPPPPPLTAKQARARLAEVVADFQATADRLAKLNTAHERSRRDSTEAFMQVEQCEALVAEAREDQPRSYVNRILNGADDEPEDLVLAAQKRLDEANRRRGNAEQAEAIIAEEIALTERRLASLRYARRDCIRELVLASPATAKLRAEWERQLAHLGNLFAAHYAIDPTTPLKGWANFSPTTEGVKIIIQLGDASVWRAALTALETDAAAKLPGE